MYFSQRTKSMTVDKLTIDTAKVRDFFENCGNKSAKSVQKVVTHERKRAWRVSWKCGSFLGAVVSQTPPVTFSTIPDVNNFLSKW